MIFNDVVEQLVYEELQQVLSARRGEKTGGTSTQRQESYQRLWGPRQQYQRIR